MDEGSREGAVEMQRSGKIQDVLWRKKNYSVNSHIKESEGGEREILFLY